MLEQQNIDKITDDLEKYVKTNYELIKLETTKSVADISSGLMSGILVGAMGFLSLIFIGLSGGYYLSQLLEDYSLGFGIIAGFYFLVAMILLLSRKSMIEKPLKNIIIKKTFNANR